MKDKPCRSSTNACRGVFNKTDVSQAFLTQVSFTRQSKPSLHKQTGRHPTRVTKKSQGAFFHEGNGAPPQKCLCSLIIYYNLSDSPWCVWRGWWWRDNICIYAVISTVTSHLHPLSDPADNGGPCYQAVFCRRFLSIFVNHYDRPTSLCWLPSLSATFRKKKQRIDPFTARASNDLPVFLFCFWRLKTKSAPTYEPPSFQVFPSTSWVDAGVSTPRSRPPSGSTPGSATSSPCCCLDR